MKLADVICPSDIVHDGLVTIFVGVLLIVVQVSVGLNPLPLTVTEVPGGPELGVSVIEGDGTVTVKVAVAKSIDVVP
jgi:hypothetical protein